MAIDVDTKDCTALSDADLAEMAELGVDGSAGFEIGTLSKQAEAWVLVTLARENDKLKGFVFSTLERIGGTPSVLLGLASVKRTAKRGTILRAMITDQLRRAVLAFPDEDVLIGTRMEDAAAYEAFKNLNDITPRPGQKASGEDRAWGRRLAKRFGVESDAYSDRDFTVTGDGCRALVFDYEALKPEEIDSEVVGLFTGLDRPRGDCLIVFGWAMTEDLLKLAP